VASKLATADGHPAQGSRYLRPVRQLRQRCRAATPATTLGAVDEVALGLAAMHLPSSRLAVVHALAAALAGHHGRCGPTVTAYLAEAAGTGPARARSGWGGYAGSVTAWNAAHRADVARPGQYLPPRHGVDAYQVLSSGQVTSLIERFDPPISAQFALAQIARDLLPGSVHVVYKLVTPQCRQAVFLGSALGGLLHSSTLGAFVELTSGGGVGHTRYDDLRVDRARITPLGAVGGQPCT
jgi:hypothetical protein